MPINPVESNLLTIQKKVRRITRSPSVSQLTDQELNDYINTFVIYDFPEQLRTFNLRTQFTFYTQPYQDVYPTDTLSFVGVTSNPLYNFQNKFISVNGDPTYIAGFQSFYTQSRQQFFGIYPIVNSIQQTGLVGDGVTTTFSGIVPIFQGNIINPGTNILNGLLQNEVMFTSIGGGGSPGMGMVDVPLKNPLTGDNTLYGNLYYTNNLPTTVPTLLDLDLNNNINYATGAFTVTFPFAPAVSAPIVSQTVPVQLSLPQALLFYEDTFQVRPVPDQTYKVNFEVYARPTQLLQDNQEPALEEYWQYIAYGASKKIFEDRLDIDSVAQIMPEFKTQERLCLRRNLVQYTNERTATIYTEQTAYGPNNSGWGFGGPF